MQGRLTAPYLNTGHLVLIGGAEDRRGDMTVLRRIVEIDAARSVVVIPSASSYGRDLADSYERAFSDLGVETVAVADVRYRDEADRDEFVAMVRAADVVFFTGGDQVKLVEVLDGSRVLQQIWSRFWRGATVAGTSAGAAAASDHMIYDGDGSGLNKGSVRTAPGFGFLEGITVDTHFIARGRIHRLAQYLSRGENKRGLGLSEDTAVLVAPGGRCEVLGASPVTVLEAAERATTNYDEVVEDELLTVDGLRLGFLAPGTQFDLRSWRVRPGTSSTAIHARPELSTEGVDHDRLRNE
jgi:cyanophycinase